MMFCECRILGTENPRVSSSILFLGTTAKPNHKEAFSDFHWKLFYLDKSVIMHKNQCPSASNLYWMPVLVG
jgi:hypothetical protein